MKALLILSLLSLVVFSGCATHQPTVVVVMEGKITQSQLPGSNVFEDRTAVARVEYTLTPSAGQRGTH